MSLPDNAAPQLSGACPNADVRVDITRDQLPLHCPRPGSTLWNSHPRVFIPLEQTGDRATCPYCGAEYALVD